MPFNIASVRAADADDGAGDCGWSRASSCTRSAIAHLYLNHLEQADLQLSRSPRALPFMQLNPLVTSIFDFKFDDFELTGYEADAHIPAPVAV